MIRKTIYNIGIVIFLALLICTSYIDYLFAAQSEPILITVTLNIEPQIQSIQPPDGSTDYPEDNIEFTVDAQDENGDNLLYQFSIDGQVQQSWSEKSTYNWTVLSSDVGLHTIKAEVTDGFGGQDFQSVEVYIFLKPVELPEG